MGKAYKSEDKALRRVARIVGLYGVWPAVKRAGDGCYYLVYDPDYDD